MLRHYLKKWGDFSSSPIKPLFWMLIGPLFILVSLLVSIPTSKDLFFPSLSALGLLLIWKWRFNGLTFTLLTFAVYFSFQYFFKTHGVALWKLGWGCSFALALIISFLSMEELKKHYLALKNEGDRSLSDLKLALHTAGEKAASEKRLGVVEVEKLKEELSKTQLEIKDLLQLVEASQLESEKAQRQHQVLSTESLQNHRQLETLKLEVKQRIGELEKIQVQYGKTYEESKKRLNQLNFLRTEYAQMHLLFDAAQKDFQKFRSVILSQRELLLEKGSPKGKAPVSEPTPAVKEKSEHLVLKTLEKDKAALKKIYLQIQKDHESLSLKLKEAQSSEEEHVHLLENKVLEEKKKLEKTKTELVSLEREIFVIKKELQQQGLETV